MMSSILKIKIEINSDKTFETTFRIQLNQERKVVYKSCQ
jgi:hypothetical protein